MLYHEGKSNVVVDALNMFYMGSLSHIDKGKRELVKEVHKLA